MPTGIEIRIKKKKSDYDSTFPCMLIGRLNPDSSLLIVLWFEAFSHPVQIGVNDPKFLHGWSLGVIPLVTDPKFLHDWS